MSRHLAPDELLLDYAAGAMAEGPALALAVHVALNPAARWMVDRLEAVAGALLDGEDEVALPDAELQQVQRRLSDASIEPRTQLPHLPALANSAWSPRPLRRYLDNTARWRRRAIGGFDEMPLRLEGRSHSASLLRLEPGRGLPVHRHSGDEYTVVLQGGFTDSIGRYAAGDFCVGPDGVHEPIADAGEPCIALIVLDNPIILTGPIGRFLNPLVRRGWL